MSPLTSLPHHLKSRCDIIIIKGTAVIQSVQQTLLYISYSPLFYFILISFHLFLISFLDHRSYISTVPLFVLVSLFLPGHELKENVSKDRETESGRGRRRGGRLEMVRVIAGVRSRRGIGVFAESLTPWKSQRVLTPIQARCVVNPAAT